MASQISSCQLDKRLVKIFFAALIILTGALDQKEKFNA